MFKCSKNNTEYCPVKNVNTSAFSENLINFAAIKIKPT